MPVTEGRLGHARVAVLTAVRGETEALRQVAGLSLRVPTWDYYIAPDADPLFPKVIHREINRNNIQSGESVREVIEHWRPELLVLCGIAGGINNRENVTVGDIVIPRYIHYYTFAKLTAGGQQRRYIPFDYPSIYLHGRYLAPLQYDSSWITDSLRSALPANCNPKVHVDSLVAGDKIYGNPDAEDQKVLVQQYDEAVAVDMESVGVCRGVAAMRNDPQYNPRLLIVRSVSDMIGDHDNDEMRKTWRPHACTIASTFTWRVVTDILATEPDPRKQAEVAA
ncbi:hypothetical protein [Streptomyces sp. NPDC048200]|uniref:5'-methylthioadenosine/S-adenosylhomocysteine nucleosidase family protein n=1 Tax=Streptomyces sp. NPDC048200 TaxID=3365512 RepID=UPI0037109AF6